MKEESRDPGVPKYHYEREERTASLPESVRERGGKRILKGNRSLIITLVDVVFLVLLVIIFSFVGRLAGDTSVISGYTVSAAANQFGDRVMVSIKVAADEDQTKSEPVRIRLRYSEGTERVELSEFLPVNEGDESTFRGAIPYDGRSARIVIDFFTGNEWSSMEEKIRRE